LLFNELILQKSSWLLPNQQIIVLMSLGIIN